MLHFGAGDVCHIHCTSLGDHFCLYLCIVDPRAWWSHGSRLAFELPVVFMLRRELGHAQKVPPKWLQNPRRARSHWISTYLAFLVGRGPAECLWIVSMLDTPFGHPLLEESLSSASIVVYHTLAFFFTSLNVRISWIAFLLALARCVSGHRAPERTGAKPSC